MPLVAHSDLPSFSRLRASGHEVLDVDRAVSQDIRELHIGFLNMMPDAALRATERQFMILIGSCNRIAQFYVHPFAVDADARGGDAQQYIANYYEDFDKLREQGLDALIITGANPLRAKLEQEAFWQPLTEVLDWARGNTCSMLCSCLATHADLQHTHDVQRQKLTSKRWGVYSHAVRDDTPHPLINNINTRFDAPHSHIYEVTREQMESAGARVLVESEDAGVHLAVSADQFRVVYFQGHPEYERHSLLKEFKREVNRFGAREREDYPAYPQNYFSTFAQEILSAHRDALDRALIEGLSPPPFPEEQLVSLVHNTWSDTGKALVNNWLGLVYQLTHPIRGELFMPGVDPADPLNLRGEASPEHPLAHDF